MATLWLRNGPFALRLAVMGNVHVPFQTTATQRRQPLNPRYKKIISRRQRNAGNITLDCSRNQHLHHALCIGE